MTPKCSVNSSWTRSLFLILMPTGLITWFSMKLSQRYWPCLTGNYPPWAILCLMSLTTVFSTTFPRIFLVWRVSGDLCPRHLGSRLRPRTRLQAALSWKKKRQRFLLRNTKGQLLEHRRDIKLKLSCQVLSDYKTYTLPQCLHYKFGVKRRILVCFCAVWEIQMKTFRPRQTQSWFLLHDRFWRREPGWPGNPHR